MLIAYLPFGSILSSMIPLIGWAKDILCLMIVFLCVFARRKIRVNYVFCGVLIYTLMVVFNLLSNGSIPLGDKIDAFRYRVEYAITLCILFNSYYFTRNELIDVLRKILKILYYTGVLVAIIGLIEMINPSLIYSLYGSGLTSHLSIYSAGVLQTRLISTMGNPINLGLQMNLSILAALYIQHEPSGNGQKKNRNLGKYINWISIVIFVIVEIFTYSRTAYIITVFLFLSFYFMRIFVLKIGMNKKIVSMFVVLVIGLLAMLILSSNEAFVARFATVTLESFTKNVRFERAYTSFFEGGINVFKIVLGYGVGNVLRDGGQYVFELGYASLLYETGIIGYIVFFSAFSLAITKGLKMIKNKDGRNGIAIPFMSFLVGFMVAMITEDVYFQLPFSLYFWLSVLALCGLSSISYKK